MPAHRLIYVPQEGNAEALLPKLRAALGEIAAGNYDVDEKRVNVIRVLREAVAVLTFGHPTDIQWEADQVVEALDRLADRGLYLG